MNPNSLLSSESRMSAQRREPEKLSRNLCSQRWDSLQ